MSWIQTFSGIPFDLLDPQPDMVCIEDIAHALAAIPRFTGHTKRPYTVAQHSCLVAELLPDEWKLAGLLHDATEAYVNDLATPLKRELPDYKAIEARIWSVIVDAFNLPNTDQVNDCVKRADLTLLLTERRDLMGTPPQRWHEDLERIPPLPWKVRPWWFHWNIKRRFLDRFWDYTDLVENGPVLSENRLVRVA